MPKGAMRILDAARVQAEYRARKRKKQEAQQKRQRGEAVDDEENEAGPSMSKAAASSKLKIRPGEKLGDYNRRVEQAMASQVASTARSEARKRKKQKRAERAAAAAGGSDDEDDEDAQWRRHAKGKDEAERRAKAEPSKEDLKRARQDMSGGKEVDFAKASQVRRINDVAQAPPSFTKLPRGQGAEAIRRKEVLAAALRGEEAPQPRASSKKVTKGQMPEPVAPRNKKAKSSTQEAGAGKAAATGGLRREKELEEERQRAIKLYRERKGIQNEQVERRRSSKHAMG